MYKVMIKIDALPLSVNQTGRWHWAKKTKLVNEWKSLVALAVAGRRPPVPLKYAKVIFTRFSAKAMDYDNLVNSYKAVQDGLVAAGILEDDKIKNIGHPEYYWGKVPQKDGHILIEVEELSAPPQIPKRNSPLSSP